eukprot:snap_masked-scaffold_6-processed-gene-10.22-mRNA-1 protein AED:1.00 eAED:1.00 QI:0/-1/0/0/-1/1/1/0/212
MVQEKEEKTKGKNIYNIEKNKILYPTQYPTDISCLHKAQGAFLNETQCCAQPPYNIQTRLGVLQVNSSCISMNHTFERYNLEPYNPFPFNLFSGASVTPPTDPTASSDLWCPTVNLYSNSQSNIHKKWGYCFCGRTCSNPMETDSPTLDEPFGTSMESRDASYILFWFVSLILTCPCLFFLYFKNKRNISEQEQEMEAKREKPVVGSHVVLS